MKTFIIALAVLILITSAVIINGVYINDLTDELLDMTKALPDVYNNNVGSVLTAAKDIADLADKHYFLISLSAGHVPADKIKLKADQIICKIGGEDATDYILARTELIDALYELKRSENFSLKEIL